MARDRIARRPIAEDWGANEVFEQPLGPTDVIPEVIAGEGADPAMAVTVAGDLVTGGGDNGLTSNAMLWAVVGAGALWFLMRKKKAA